MRLRARFVDCAHAAVPRVKAKCSLRRLYCGGVANFAVYTREGEFADARGGFCHPWHGASFSTVSKGVRGAFRRMRRAPSESGFAFGAQTAHTQPPRLASKRSAVWDAGARHTTQFSTLGEKPVMRHSCISNIAVRSAGGRLEWVK